MLPPPPSNDLDLVQYIEAAGETPNVDAKGPMEWDGGDCSASLAKDVMALSNTRDGGVLVIGKAERPKGTFVLEGVSLVQAVSFETTKVAAWVNTRCQPPVHLTCYQVTHKDKLFVVITVKEFDDIPTLCTSDCQTSDGKKPLRCGTVYVRTANAESAPLQTVEQLRQLIGLATLKRGDQLLTLFQSMLKGQPILPPLPTANPYDTEIADLESLLNDELIDSHTKGGWTFVCYPEGYLQERWSTDELLQLLDSCSIKVRGRPFPGRKTSISHHNQGIMGSYYGESAFGWNKSGLFVSRHVFPENIRAFENPWRPAFPTGRNPDFPAGTWLEFEINLYVVIEFYWFLSRLAHELTSGAFSYALHATGLKGRRLATTNANITLDPSDPCKSPEYTRHKVVPVESIAVGWEDECSAALHDFFRLFVGDSIGKDMMMKWIERFKARG